MSITQVQVVTPDLQSAVSKFFRRVLHGWQWMLAIEGGLSIAVGVVTYFWLDSHIEDANWLTTAEKTALIDTIAAEEVVKAATSGVADKRSRWRILADPQLILFCWIYFAIQLSIYANTFWLPSIVRLIHGLTTSPSDCCPLCPWTSAVVAMYVFSRLG